MYNLRTWFSRNSNHVLHQILTNFKNSFAGTLSSKLAKWLMIKGPTILQTLCYTTRWNFNVNFWILIFLSSGEMFSDHYCKCTAECAVKELSKLVNKVMTLGGFLFRITWYTIVIINNPMQCFTSYEHWTSALLAQVIKCSYSSKWGNFCHFIIWLLYKSVYHNNS